MKKSISVFMVLMSIFAINAFEWTQNPVEIEEYFSENRGGSFNSGVVYSKEGNVSVAEDGKCVMTIVQYDDMGWFVSPLGNSAIVVHDNNMMSVYSNLDKNFLIDTQKEVVLGEIIAKSGKSSWISGEKDDDFLGSGFSVLDIERATIINPVVLMKEDKTGSYISIRGLKAVDRRGKKVDLYNGALIDAGQYTLYMEKPKNSMIHQSQVSLNGEIKEKTSYDSIHQEGNALTVAGNGNYTFLEIYPDDTYMRLADVLLQRGTSTIEILLSNNGGSKTSNRYRLNVK